MKLKNDLLNLNKTFCFLEHHAVTPQFCIFFKKTKLRNNVEIFIK